MSRGTIVQLLTSGDAGGGQLVSLRIAESLVRSGYTVRFVTPAAGPITRLCAAIGEVDVVPLNSLRDLGQVRAVSRYLRKVSANLLHTHTPIAAALLWRMGARLAGVPVVHHVHTANFYGRGLKARAARALDTLTVRSVKAIVAVSDTTRDELVELGYPRDLVRTIYNAIPFEKRPPVDVRSSPDLIIGCVGRLSKMKGQMELLESFPHVKARFPEARLWFVGTADASEHQYEAALSVRAAQLGVTPHVSFWGHRDDVEVIIRQLTMLVLPSKFEAFPLVLLEAMSAGVPAIATDVGGVSELVRDGETGVIVPVSDPGALASAIIGLAESESLRDKLSRAAYDFVWSRFDTRQTTDEAVSVIEKAATA